MNMCLCGGKRTSCEEFGYTWMREVGQVVHPSVQLLLLLLGLTLATVGVARRADLDVVANDSLDDRANTGEEKNQSEPVVPNVCSNHGLKRSE